MHRYDERDLERECHKPVPAWLKVDDQKYIPDSDHIAYGD